MYYVVVYDPENGDAAITYQTTRNIKFEILVTWCRNSRATLRKLYESANSPVLWCIYNSGKYKCDANLGSARCRFLSTRTLHPLHGPNRCVRIIGTSCNPVILVVSSPAYRVPLCASIAPCVSLASRHLRSRFNLPARCARVRRHRKIFVRGEESAWSDDECGIVVEGYVRQRGTDARVHREIGRSWWDYFFSRPLPFATCTDFFFLYIFDLAFG